MGWTVPRTWTDGEFVTAAIMNAQVRDNLLNIGQHVYVPKSSDQNKASDTVMAADSALVLPVGTNQTWKWRARVYIITGAGGFQFRWDVPASATGTLSCTDVNGTATAIFEQNDLPYGTADGSTASITDAGHFVGILQTGLTSGNLSLVWAQNASNGANSTVKAGSYIMARRIA